jgi:hypothetical protein
VAGIRNAHRRLVRKAGGKRENLGYVSIDFVRDAVEIDTKR